jgi:large subunit ribosomal protein L11
LKLIIPSGKATAGPPIGPALGQKGVKAIDFCKQFNDASKPFLPETPLRCFVTVRPDRTFSFSIRPPSTTWFLKRVTGVERASSEPGKVVAEVSAKYLYEVAKVKQAEDPGMARLPLRSVYSMLLASATKSGFSIF